MKPGEQNENLGSVHGSEDNQERWVGTMRELGKTNKSGESNGKEVNWCYGEGSGSWEKRVANKKEVSSEYRREFKYNQP